MKLKPGQYYEIEIFPMGISKDGDHTVDDESWKDGRQTHWNIWVVLRQPDRTIDEVLDLDIPEEMTALADDIYEIIANKIERCNIHNIALF